MVNHTISGQCAVPPHLEWGLTRDKSYHGRYVAARAIRISLSLSAQHLSVLVLRYALKSKYMYDDATGTVAGRQAGGRGPPGWSTAEGLWPNSPPSGPEVLRVRYGSGVCRAEGKMGRT